MTDQGTGSWLAARFDVSFDRTTAAVAAMVLLDVVWWLLVVDGHLPMPGMMWLMEQGIPMAAPGAMERGVFHVGTLGAIAGYLVMWGVMMWAMMQPAMTRFVREYAAAHEGSALAVTTAVTGFLGGYSLVWLGSGVLPLGLDAVLPGGIYGVTRAHTSLVVGGALVCCGLYQLSSFKQSRLRTCCASVDAHTNGLGAGFANGLVHGGSCVLVCFGPFFLLMPFFGEMNLVWMVVLTGVVALERLPDWGREVATATGLAAFLAGLAVLLVQPPLPIAFGM